MPESVFHLRQIKILKQRTLFIIRSNRSEVFCKKGVLRNFSKFAGKHVPESQEQVFSSEFYKFSKNTFFYRTPSVAASILCKP